MYKMDVPSNVLDKDPNIHDSVFIAKGAVVIGDVTLKKASSVWYNSVLRGDINRIEVGERTNIQDGSVIHLENNRECILGNDVTVGHKAILHACTIEDGCLIGMGAIVLSGAVIKRGSIIAAGAVVLEDTTVEPFSLMVGMPAKCIRKLENRSLQENIQWASKYVELARIHKGSTSKKQGK